MNRYQEVALSVKKEYMKLLSTESSRRGNGERAEEERAENIKNLEWKIATSQGVYDDLEDINSLHVVDGDETARVKKFLKDRTDRLQKEGHRGAPAVHSILKNID